MIGLKTVAVVVALIGVFLVVCTESSCSYHARLRRNAKTPDARPSLPNLRVRRQSSSCNDSYPYRMADGSCNNLNNPSWGKAGGVQFLRLLAPVYNDSIGVPRIRATDGSDLPNPRAISNHVHFELPFPSLKHSNMIMQWGQFVDHDITWTPNEQDNGTDIDCCARNDSVLTDSSSPCFPIHVPDNDDYFNDGKCINFVRSDPFPNTGDSVSNPRQQYNQVSAFIDGSMIYGISGSEMDELRNKSSGYGLMKVHNSEFLPEGPQADCLYDSAHPEYYCFDAGDDRVNAFFGLGFLHTLFLREHNRVATELHSLNSGWDDEKVFQETRRIVIGELQVITYNDWLPEILSNDGVANYSLGAGNYAYNSSINPSFNNVFSSAAFRFGHSMISNNFTIGSSTVDTRDLLKTTKYVIDSMEDVVETLTTEPAQRADAWYPGDMRNKLFETDSSTKDGDDIVVLNLQRGREHGLPGYNEWREYCKLPKLTDFLDSNTDFGIIQGNDLKDMYNSVNDIDMYSGGISEKPFDKAAIGRTYICLLGETFFRLRDGDRFWYETQDATVGFSTQQITQLGRASLARVICDNTDITSIQRDVFRQPNVGPGGANNAQNDCSQLSSINLQRWNE